MVPWLFFALLNPLLFGVVGVFDKFLRDKHLGTVSLSIFSGIFSFWVLAIIPFSGFSASASVVAVGLLAGALFFLVAFPYYQALSVDEVSRVVPLWALGAPITLVLSFVFLGERLAFNDYISFSLVVAGAFLVSSRNFGDAFRPGRAFLFMLLANLLTSANVIIAKWLYSRAPFWSVFVLEGLGTGISALVFLAIFALRNKKLPDALLGLGRGVYAKLGMRQVVMSSAFVAFSLAVLKGSPSLTYALSSLDSMFAFFIATLLSLFMPHVIEEVIDRKTLLTKAFAIAIIIAGVFLINGGV